MSRTIDRVIDYIEGLDSSGGLSPTIKRVLVNRINVEPTREELDQARNELYGS